MKKENICFPKKYKTSTGEEKIEWMRVGVLFIKDDGKKSIKLNPHFDYKTFVNKDGEIWLNSFEEKQRN